MNTSQSDALVFFGARGDMVFKKIFPALQAMAKRGRLDVPVISVARAYWTADQLRVRARDSLEKHWEVDPAASEQLYSLPRYVSGDYTEPATFQALRKELGGAERPAHYLAIPPQMFETVVQHLKKSGCAKGARVLVEKPFGRDLHVSPVGDGHCAEARLGTHRGQQPRVARAAYGLASAAATGVTGICECGELSKGEHSFHA